MSIKALLVTVGAALCAVALVVILIPAADSSARYVDAQLTVSTGLSSSSIVSHLKCKNDAASGDGVYSSAKQASAGCAAVTKLEAKLQAKPAICPGRSQGGEITFRVKGKIDGKPVDLYSLQQDCSQSLAQINDLSLLIRSAQQPSPPLTAQIVMMPPAPPAITEMDQKKTEALIKKLGWKGYQQYIADKTGEQPRMPRKSQNLKACVVPLPKYFARACFLRVPLKPGQTSEQVSKNLRTTHPQWFIGKPPTANQLNQTPGSPAAP
jgi:hypothetical protein